MRLLPVVMRSVCGKHAAEVLLPEDQHPVGEFGADGQDEAFGEAVRPRTPGWDLDHLDTRLGQHRAERGRELSGPVADEEPAPISRSTAARMHQSTSVPSMSKGACQSLPPRWVASSLLRWLCSAGSDCWGRLNTQLSPAPSSRTWSPTPMRTGPRKPSGMACTVSSWPAIENRRGGARNCIENASPSSRSRRVGAKYRMPSRTALPT